MSVCLLVRPFVQSSALAHLGCTCEVGTSESTTNTMNVVEIITPNYDINAWSETKTSQNNHDKDVGNNAKNCNNRYKHTIYSKFVRQHIDLSRTTKDVSSRKFHLP